MSHLYRFARLTILLVVISFATQSTPLSAGELTTLSPYFREISLTGFTYPIKEITLTSEVGGRIDKVFADIGDEIGGEGIFAEIDPTFILLDIEANAIAQQRTARQLQQEEKTLARFTTLLNQRSTPQAQLDEVSLAADLHRIELKQLKNNEVRLRERLSRHTILAPSQWQVIERMAEEGEFIQSGQAVAKLGDFRKLLIPFALTIEELQAVDNMEQISLYLPDIDVTTPANLYRRSPSFDPVTRKIAVDLLIDSSKQSFTTPLRGGMRAILRLRNREDGQAFQVDSRALINRYEATWLVNQEGKRMQVILLGTLEDGALSIVSSDTLKAGQQFQLNPELGQ